MGWYYNLTFEIDHTSHYLINNFYYIFLPFCFVGSFFAFIKEYDDK